MLPLLPILTGAFNPSTWATLGLAAAGFGAADSLSRNFMQDDYLKAMREAGGPPARSSSNDLNRYHYMVQMRLKAIRERDRLAEYLSNKGTGNEKIWSKVYKSYLEYNDSIDAWGQQITELGTKLQLPGYKNQEFTPIFDPRSLGKTQEPVEEVKEDTSNYDPFYFMKPGYSSPVSANTDLPRTGSVESFGSISNSNTNKQTLQQAVSLLGLNNDYNLSLEASKAQQKRFWDSYKI